MINGPIWDNRHVSSELQTEDPASESTTSNGPMLMVVTLKSGVQIRTDVTEYTVQKTRGGTLVGLKWQATEATEAAIEHLDMSEVAAVHTEWPR